MRRYKTNTQRATAASLWSRLNEVFGSVLVAKPEAAAPELVAYVAMPNRVKTRVPKIRQQQSTTKQVVSTQEKEQKRAYRKERRRAFAAKVLTPTSLIVTLNVAVLVIVSFALMRPMDTPVVQVERNAASALEAPLQRYLPMAAASTTESVTTTVPRYAWIAPWNATSLTSLQRKLSNASAFWLTVNEDGASLSTKGDWSIWQNYAQGLDATTERYVTVSGDPDYTYLTIASPVAQASFITNLIETAQAQSFTGVDINFEMLGEENRELFTSFIRNLAAYCRSTNMKLAVTVEARIGNAVPMDWRTLGSIADEVRVMAYDYHSRVTREPGPIAPLGWVQDVVRYAVQQVPATKLVIGLGNYGYQWRAPLEPNGLWEGVGVSYDTAMSLATESGAVITSELGIDSRGYDIGGTPSFSYTDSEGRMRSVWFENDESLSKKLAVLSSFSVKGVIFWSVGLGDPLVWIDPTRPNEISPRVTAIPTANPSPAQ
jgi:spore germination protein YaaH